MTADGFTGCYKDQTFLPSFKQKERCWYYNIKTNTTASKSSFSLGQHYLEIYFNLRASPFGLRIGLWEIRTYSIDGYWLIAKRLQLSCHYSSTTLDLTSSPLGSSGLYVLYTANISDDTQQLVYSTCNLTWATYSWTTWKRHWLRFEGRHFKP